MRGAVYISLYGYMDTSNFCTVTELFEWSQEKDESALTLNFFTCN